MVSGSNSGGTGLLPPICGRILYVRNLPYTIENDSELYDLFGKYGGVAQIRVGDQPTTKGTGYVIYHDIYDAKAAVDALNGFKFSGRFLVVTYHNSSKMRKE